MRLLRRRREGQTFPATIRNHVHHRQASRLHVILYFHAIKKAFRPVVRQSAFEKAHGAEAGCFEKGASLFAVVLAGIKISDAIYFPCSYQLHCRKGGALLRRSEFIFSCETGKGLNPV